MSKGTVVAAMSGGVDSAVTAALLQQEGYDVIGITLQIWQEHADQGKYGGCCSLGAVEDVLTLEVPVVAGVAQEQWASLVKDYVGMQCGDPGIEAVQRFTVPVRRLDGFGLTDVTSIKLDAEGAEGDVLRGAAETLARCRPVLSVEIEERHCVGSTRAVPRFLARLGYRGFYEFYGDWRPVEDFDPLALQRASPSPAVFEASHPYVFCFYFVPAERVAELAGLARLP